MYISGIAPNCKILPVKFYKDSQISDSNAVRLIRALEYVKKIQLDNPNNRLVINLSYQFDDFTLIQKQEVNDALEGCYNVGIPIFCPAGNDHTEDIYFPANSTYTNSVARIEPGVNNNYEVYENYSNIGETNNFAAPGSAIITIAGDINKPVVYFSGASAATPIATGIAALLLSQDNNLTPDELKRILQYTCSRIQKDGENAINYNWNQNMPGHSKEIGYGKLDAYKAVTDGKFTINFANNVENNRTDYGQMNVNENWISTNSDVDFIINDELCTKAQDVLFFHNGYQNKFFNWELIVDDIYERSLLNKVKLIVPINNYDAYYNKTKHIKIENYLEGVSDDSIWFGEYGFNAIQNGFKIRNSGFTENAFYYNQLRDINFGYKAQAKETIIGLYNTSWNFINWENCSEELIKNEVINENTPSVWKAYFKGIHKSDNSNGFNKNNQKKIVRTDDGILHMVYESMGKVWYEYSINSGQTWTLGNYGKALNNGSPAKNPTIDYMSDKIVIIAYQSTNSVSVEVFDKNYPNYYDPSYGPYTFIDRISYSENVTPVIGISYGQGSVNPINSKILLIYKLNTASLAYQTADLDINSATISNITVAAELPNTSTSSAAPSLAAYKPNTTSKYYHLAYQDGAEVKYKRIVLNGSTLSIDRETTLSTGSGFTNNYNPSITVLSDNSPVVSWVGYRTLRDERLEKANAGTYEERIVLRRGYSSGSWSSVFNKYDDEVNTPSVSSALMGYALGWSSENGSTNKIVRSDYGNQIFTTTQVGRDVQLSNGSSHNNIRFITLNTSALPYAFYNQPLPTDIPLKTSSLAVANGREGIVTKGEAGFYYLIGDVVLDQTTINFTELTDETTIGNETELNSYLTTEEFTINNNSDLTFSVRFGTVDSVTTANTLNDNEYVRFRVELVDAATNELLGTFSSVEYTKTNLYQYNNIGYSVNTDGIGNKKVKIRLSVEDNVEAEYTIAHIIADETVLGKTNYTEISYLGELSVETYELAQNYPNPFNPETVIYYQIPESGEVSLKVYDMLGRELKTLVNQIQNQGRYEVKFNARDLASGVYIYRLQVNDFVTSKKMMLVK